MKKSLLILSTIALTSVIGACSKETSTNFNGTWEKAKGESSICTIDRKDADEHRKESLSGIETKPGYDRDEFPMAMCAEGGNGADVKLVHSSDNRGAGSWVSHQLSGLPDGTRVLIKVK